MGGVDVLIYNAGSGSWQTVEEITPQAFEQSWRVNALGALVASQRVIPAMKAKGYDLTVHTSKSLDAIPEVTFDAAITMGCGDACPNLRAKRREDWALPDPRDMPPEEFNRVRDEIERRVVELLNSLK